METLEQYQARIGTPVDLSAAFKRRVFIAGVSCVETMIQDEVIYEVEEESHITVLVRDLGTLTPYRELGRGRP